MFAIKMKAQKQLIIEFGNAFVPQGAPGKDGDVGAPGPSGIAVCISLNLT